MSDPVLLNDRTLMYLATDTDGSGPWLHRRTSSIACRTVSARVSNRYTSLAASADGRRLVATLANPNGTFWRLGVGETAADTSSAAPISLTTGHGFAPRVGSGLLVVCFVEGDERWHLEARRRSGDRAVERAGRANHRRAGGRSRRTSRCTFSASSSGRTLLYVMNADGTNAQVVTESLELQGDPAWTPDGQSITSAANVDGTPHLFRIALERAQRCRSFRITRSIQCGRPTGESSFTPGADIGTTFPVKAVTAAGGAYSMPNLTLTRGARRLRFLHGRRVLVVMRGDIEHKNLWSIDLETGAERQLTNLAADFNVRDFDISADGREIVLERVQEHSDIVLIDLAPRRN